MASKTADRNASTAANPRYWVGLVIAHLLMPPVLLISAGDPGWWQGWLNSALLVVVGLGSRMCAEKRHPGLLAERGSFGNDRNVKSWDKVLSPLMALSMSYPLFIVAGLDHRFVWSPVIPTWLNILGFTLIVPGYTFAGWALAENRFFSSVVRIQTDRGHTVCDSGPYRIVRHPGYAGNVLALPGVVLALGSVWTIVPVILALIIAVMRTALEDKALQDELPGYRDYVRRVRYRLIPGVF